MVVVGSIGLERRSRDAVRDLGIPCYQPILREQETRQGRRRWVERLMLGRYFFAKWQPHSDAWKEIPNLRDVQELFCAQAPADWPRGAHFPVVPALVADEEIEAIRALENEHGVVVPSKVARFSPNQAVRVVGGVFAGFVGRYAHHRRNVDVALIEIFGAQTKIEFAPGALVAA